MSRDNLQLKNEALSNLLGCDGLEMIDEIEEDFSRGTIIIDDVYFECTCRVCPEQYDVYINDKYVAYVRKRHGILRVHPVINDEIDWDTIIYEEKSEDKWSGVIDNREETLSKISAIIKKQLTI